MSDLTPVISESFSIPFSNISERVSLGNMEAVFTDGNSIPRPSIHIGRTDPTLLEVYSGHHSWTNNRGAIKLPHKDRWIYAVIET